MKDYKVFYQDIDFSPTLIKVKVLKCTTLTLTVKVQSSTLNFNTFSKYF